MAASDLTFRVMGSTAHVVVVADEGAELLRLGRERLARLEATWTRFDPDSTISRLNRQGGVPVEVDLDTLVLMARSRDAWVLTDGLFDPTVAPSLAAAGYDRPLDPNGRSSAARAARAQPAPGVAGIEVDPTRRSVLLPAGLEIDPGGIGKGLAADLVASELMAMGADGAMVNVGGDLRTMGIGPAGAEWVVAIENPFDDQSDVAQVTLIGGGVATTTPRHRLWVTDTGPGVHVIDPRTGTQTTTDVESVTVLAAEAWMAEAATKAVAVAGAEAGVDLLDGMGLAGLVVTDDGRVRMSSRMGAFL